MNTRHTPRARAARDEQQKRRRRKPIDLQRVQLALGEAIEQLEHYALAPAANGERVNLADLCKLTHALAQAAGVFKALTEAGALEELNELRDSFGELKERVSEIESSRLRA